MTKQPGDHHDVGAGPQPAGRRGVPQDVRAEVRQPGVGAELGDDALQLPGSQPAAPAQPQAVLPPLGGRVVRALVDPPAQLGAGVSQQRDGARPLPLAGPHVHRAGALGGGHVVDVERGGLGQPQSGPGQQREQRSVSSRAGPAGGPQQPADLVLAQGAGSARRLVHDLGPPGTSAKRS